MNTSTMFDTYMERIEAGEPLSAEQIQEWAAAPDILPLGMDCSPRLAAGRSTRVRPPTTGA